jgi:hypothetical protein
MRMRWYRISRRWQRNDALPVGAPEEGGDDLGLDSMDDSEMAFWKWVVLAELRIDMGLNSEGKVLLKQKR